MNQKLNLFFSFINFFDNLNYQKIFDLNQRIDSLSNNIYILNCNFYLLSDYNGGSIFLNTNNIKICIEYSNFQNCTASNNGGAIYISCLNLTSIVLNKICSSFCSANSPSWNLGGGQFIFNEVSNNEKNYIFETSIYKSSYIYSSKQSSLYLKNGIINIKSINSSNNLAEFAAMASIFGSQNLTLKYSNFIKNNVSIYDCLWIGCGSTNYGEVFHNNFINNYSPHSSEGIIHNPSYITSTYLLDNCILIDNIGTLFTRNAGMTLIKNCWIYHQFTLTSGSNIIIENTKSITNTFSFSKIICKNLNYSLNIQKKIKILFISLILLVIKCI